MRAIQIEPVQRPTQVLRVVDIEEPPPPGPHEVLVSVEVSPLNKHDLLVVSGVLARPPLPTYQAQRGSPACLPLAPRSMHFRSAIWSC